MYSMFGPDSKIYQFLEKIWQLFLLNLLCLLCCLPVVTAGASITALYYVSLKMARGDGVHIIRDFFHSFRQNLLQGTGITLILLAVGVFLAFEYSFSHAMVSQIPAFFYELMNTTFWVMLVIYFMVLTYVFALLSRFDNPVKQTLKNALLMSIRHLPTTFCLLLISAAPFLLGLVLFLTAYTVVPLVILFYSLLGLSATAYFHSFLFLKVFQKYVAD